MSNDSIPDYSETPADNEDVGGIDIRGTAKASGMRLALQTLLSQLKKTSTGTTIVEDTWSFADPVDQTKRARLDAGNVTAGQTRVIKAPDFDIDLTNLMRVFRGFIFGLTLSNAADTDHDITIAAGTAASDDSNPTLINLSSAITKQADATFAEGSAAGGMVSGESLPTSGTVHVWLIMKADGTADVCFNNNASSGLSPTLPSGFTYKRRIGSLRTDGSANIRNFIQVGDEFTLLLPLQDSTTTGLTQTHVSFACTVPQGIRVKVIGAGFTYHASSPNISVNLRTPDVTDASVSSANLTFNSPVTNVPNTFGIVGMLTNTSGQLRVNSAATNTGFTFNTRGWIDDRGKNG